MATDLNDPWAVCVWIETDLDTGRPVFTAELRDCSPAGGATMLWRGRGQTTELALVHLAHAMATELEARCLYLPDDYVDVADRGDREISDQRLDSRVALARSILGHRSFCDADRVHVDQALAALDGATIEQLAGARS